MRITHSIVAAALSMSAFSQSMADFSVLRGISGYIPRSRSGGQVAHRKWKKERSAGRR